MSDEDRTELWIKNGIRNRCVRFSKAGSRAFVCLRIIRGNIEKYRRWVYAE